MKFDSGEKKWLLFCVVLIALPLGVGVYFNRINATPALNIPAYPQAPNPNGYDLYVAAATAMTRAKPEVDPNSDRTLVADPKARAGRYSLARRQAWLNQNTKAFALFNQAMKTRTLAPPMRGVVPTTTTLAQLRQLARDKAAQSNTLWMTRDYNGALRSALDTVQLGHDMRRGTQIIGSLTGIAVGAIGRRATGDAIEHLDATQAKSAARRLENLLAKRWNLDQTLTEEKYSTLSFMVPLVKSGGWRLTGMPWDLQTQKPSVSDRLHLATMPNRKILQQMESEFDRQIANARLPFASKALKTRPNYRNPFVSEEYKTRLNDARDLSGDRLLLLQLALRAYRLEQGQYPPTLNALVPNYLKTVPADPFGAGEAMRYKRSGQTYVLWSIGPDGKDDGGTPIPPKRKATRRYAGERPFTQMFTDFAGQGDVVAGVNG